MRHSHSLSHCLFATLLLIWLPASLKAQNTPGNLDADTYKLRMWLRADKTNTLTLVPQTPDEMTWSGTPYYPADGSLKYYVPFKGETNPTGDHQTVMQWRDYAGYGQSGGSPAAGYLGKTSVNPQTGVNAHRGTWWEYSPTGHDNPHRNLPPVWLNEHPLTNYHPTVYFWYRSPDGNLRGNDEEGAFLSNEGTILPFMNGNDDDPRPQAGKHTAFFLVNTSFPAQYKRVFFMGMNKKDQNCAGNGPSWGIFRIENEANADLGMSNGRFRAPSNIGYNTGYDNSKDPGLINKFATTIAGYQTYGYTGSGYSTQYQDIYLDFIFNGSKLSVGNSGEGTHWNYVTTREGTLGAAYDRFMGGLISEVILFEKKLPATEIAKINSYLALKYGITLSNASVTKDQGVSGSYNRGDALKGENDYTIPSTGTMLWQGTSSAVQTGGGTYKGFYHNLSAIIRDDASDSLLNLQSHSTDAGSIIRMGYLGGAIGDSNPGTADYLGPNMQRSDFGALPNLKFVMWGHDAGIYNSASYIIDPSTICVAGAQMMNKTWMVRKSDGTTPYQMLISAQNNNELFEDDAFPFGADVDVYLCIGSTYADVRNSNFHTVIKSEYVNGEHQFNYIFKEEFTYFTLAYVSTGISASCHGKIIEPGAYLNFVGYTNGYALPWQSVSGTPAAHFHKQIGNIPATATSVAQQFWADVTTDYGSVNRPSSRFPREKRGFLRVTRRGGSTNAAANTVTVNIGTRSNVDPTVPVPSIPSFTISSINRRHNTNDEVTVYGICDNPAEKIKAKLSYASSPSNSKFVIENGNHARTIRSGAAGRRNPKGQALVTFNQAVKNVVVEYTTSLDRRRNHIDIFPVTYKPAPIPPPVNSDGMAFTKEAERYSGINVCDKVVYWLRVENHKPTTDVTFNITDNLPSGMIWSATDILFDDTLNMGRYSRGEITVTKSGTNLTITGAIAKQSCDPATGGKVAIRVEAMFAYSNTTGGTYPNQATCTPTATAGTASPMPATMTSVDAYTHDPYTTVVAAGHSRIAPVRHYLSTSQEKYRENDIITLTYTIVNTDTLGANATAKTGVELELDFDASFIYVDPSFTTSGGLSGTPHWSASDSTFYIDAISIPIGTSSFSIQLKAPVQADYETDMYGAPIIDAKGKPQKATLNIDYDFFGSDDECEISSMDDMFGDKEIPYEATPRYIVVNKEINHSFDHPIKLSLYAGAPITTDQALCEGYSSTDVSALVYSVAAGGSPASPGAYFYNWQKSTDGGTTWANEGVTTASYTPATGLSPNPTTPPTERTYYFRRVVSDVSQAAANAAGTGTAIGNPISVTVYPKITAPTQAIETITSVTYSLPIAKIPVTSESSFAFEFHPSYPVYPSVPYHYYTWTVTTGSAYVSGDAPGSGNKFSGKLNNMSTSPQQIVYSITPYFGNCSGTPFTITLEVSGAIADPLSDTYQIDGCASLMYTYQTQTLHVIDVSNPNNDDGILKEYTWKEYYRINGGSWSSGTVLPSTNEYYTIPAYRFNTTGTTPTISTSDLIETRYECVVTNSASTPRTAELLGSSSATITFVHLGDYSTIQSLASANSGLIPVKLKTGSGAGDTLIIAHANLGAELDSLNNGITNDACDFGDLYQWGRQKDGHQFVVWGKNVNYNDTIISGSSDMFNMASLSAADYDANYQIASTSSAFGKFIYGGSISWHQSVPDSHNLWNYPKAVSDPCPAGWRVITKDEVLKLYGGSVGSSVSSTSVTVNTWKKIFPSVPRQLGGGFIVTNGSTPTNKVIFPTAGVRDRSDGKMSNAFAGAEGRLWTSTDAAGTWTSTDNDQVAIAFAYNNTYDLYTNDAIPGGSQPYNKVDGRSVRCVADVCIAPTTQPSVGSTTFSVCESPTAKYDITKNQAGYLNIQPTPGNTLVFYDASNNEINGRALPVTTPGIYTIYVTEASGDCVSTAARIPLTIHVYERAVVSGPGSVQVGDSITLTSTIGTEWSIVSGASSASMWNTTGTLTTTVTGVTPGLVQIQNNATYGCNAYYYVNVTAGTPASPLTVLCDSIVQFNNGYEIKQGVALNGQELYVKIYNPDPAESGVILTATGGGMTFQNPSAVTLPNGYSWVRLVGSGTPSSGTKGTQVPMAWTVSGTSRTLVFTGGSSSSCGTVGVEGSYGEMSIIFADNNGAGTDNWGPGYSLSTTRGNAILGGTGVVWASLTSPGGANFNRNPVGTVDVNFKLYGKNHAFDWAFSVGGTFGTKSDGAQMMHNAVNGLVGYDGEIPDIIVHAKENIGPSASSADVVKLMNAYKKHVEQGGWLIYTTRAANSDGNAISHTTILLDALGITHGTISRVNSTSFTLNSSATGRAKDLLDGPFGDLSTGTHTIDVDNNNGSCAISGLDSEASVLYYSGSDAVGFVIKKSGWKGGFICLGRNVDSNPTTNNCGTGLFASHNASCYNTSNFTPNNDNAIFEMNALAYVVEQNRATDTNMTKPTPVNP